MSSARMLGRAIGLLIAAGFLCVGWRVASENTLLSLGRFAGVLLVTAGASLIARMIYVAQRVDISPPTTER